MSEYSGPAMDALLLPVVVETQVISNKTPDCPLCNRPIQTFAIIEIQEAEVRQSGSEGMTQVLNVVTKCDVIGSRQSHMCGSIKTGN